MKCVSNCCLSPGWGPLLLGSLHCVVQGAGCITMPHARVVMLAVESRPGSRRVDFDSCFLERRQPVIIKGNEAPSSIFARERAVQTGGGRPRAVQRRPVRGPERGTGAALFADDHQLPVVTVLTCASSLLADWTKTSSCVICQGNYLRTKASILVKEK